MSTNKKKSGGSNRTHVYRGVREILASDLSTSPITAISLAAGATTVVTLAPLALVTARLSGSGFVLQTLVNQSMRWMGTTASGFKEYRVSRAVLIIVGNVSSTATGNFSVVSSPDYADIGLASVPSFSTSGPGTSVASLASKDQRFNLDIDSSWKKVSSRLMAVGSDGTTLSPVTTYGDATFCTFAVSNNSSSALGIAYIEYDIEFRKPTSSLLQA